MAYDPHQTEAQRQARQFMTDDERQWIDAHGVRERSGMSRPEIRQVRDNQRARADIEKRAMAAYGRDVFNKAQAERDRQAAEAKAAADRAKAIQLAEAGFTDREIEDHIREWDASEAASKAATQRAVAEYLSQQFMPKEPKMTVPAATSYDPPPPIDPTDADGMEARAKSLAAKAQAEPSEANRYQAMVAGTEAVKARALTRFETMQKRADEDIAEAVRAAGDDPVARSRAKAKAISSRAENLGQAEKDYQAAELAHDLAVVETAKACRLAAHRIESRKVAILADEAKASNDPHALGNPYYKPQISIADWQFDALSPAMKAKAALDGVRVYEDTPPTFSAADALNVLRSRGSADRQVLTRAELAKLDPSEQAKAARSSIILD